MSIPKRHVIVKQLPEVLSGKPGRVFLREVQGSVDVDRPRLVLDCSRLRQLDRTGVHLLLCCLEEALKRNGDVRLAALPAGARTALEITGANRLFDLYETANDAVNSFRQLPAAVASHQPVLMTSQPRSENAA